MSRITWATPLYEFLRQCNEADLERKALDCGAGGSDPPLSLFYRHGYETFGIEIAEGPLREAQLYCEANRMPLRIIRGDMRCIPFASESFGCVYSFNAIFFMTKPDIRKSMTEIKRVLRSGGLCYVNFVSVDDPDRRLFCKAAPARALLGSDRFAKHEGDEADEYFQGFDIRRKEKRWIEKAHGSGRLRQAMIEYIARKK